MVDTADTTDLVALLSDARQRDRAPSTSPAVHPPVEPFDATPEAAKLLGVLAQPPAAWRETLKGPVERGDLTSTARAGMDEIRRALLHADTAVELLGDAITMERDGAVRALLENLRAAALLYLMAIREVAAGADIRSVAAHPVIAQARGLGTRKPDSLEAFHAQAAQAPFHVWARAGGLECPSPVVEMPDDLDADAREQFRSERKLVLGREARAQKSMAAGWSREKPKAERVPGIRAKRARALACRGAA